MSTALPLVRVAAGYSGWQKGPRRSVGGRGPSRKVRVFEIATAYRNGTNTERLQSQSLEPSRSGSLPWASFQRKQKNML